MCDLYDDPNVLEVMAAKGWVEPNWEICPECRLKVHVGDWPICWGKLGCHRPQAAYHPFIAFFDRALGKHIGSLAEWNRAMKDGGWDLCDSKHDREHKRYNPADHMESFDRGFAESMRENYGGILPVGNILQHIDHPD